jgi:hypothetical protein
VGRGTRIVDPDFVLPRLERGRADERTAQRTVAACSATDDGSNRYIILTRGIGPIETAKC